MKHGGSYLNKSTMYDLKLYAGEYVNPDYTLAELV